MDQVLDMAVVDELLSLTDEGDPELLLDLIKLYLDDGPLKIHSLFRGIAAVDFDEVERAAHSLKGSSGNLGARLLQETCEQLQNTSRLHDQSTTKRLTQQAMAQFADVRAELLQLQRRYS
ncbi:MAG: Hpt domain-containing protein [Planctomycetota bacterium]|jgi:HPt (histidine-containing phosphotransfer) domain-containing protein|nr:Hpt domain-containing protein [Planctomycetota bacterium]